MPVLVLLRHGQSEWNLADRFTGWVDVDLTKEGEAQALHAGELLRAAEARFDGCFSSVQKRAIRTLWLALQAMDAVYLPHDKDWRLNERHYGALTGLNKTETRAKHGDEQVNIWRRSYDIPPPPLPGDSPFDVAYLPAYANVPAHELPRTESLKTTLARVDRIWREKLMSPLTQDRNLLIAAHGNSLRALMKILFNISDEAIVQLEMPTGNPLWLELDGKMRPISARYLDASRAQALPDNAR